MELLAFPDIKTHGEGQNGKKGCWQKMGMSRKLADIDVPARHVADMSLTFPTKVMMITSSVPLYFQACLSLSLEWLCVFVVWGMACHDMA